MDWKSLMKEHAIRYYFTLPNEIFMIKLCPGEIAVYAYLRYRANRKTHACWPSYKTIGNDVGMSKNTVSKYVEQLVKKHLINYEYTDIMTKDGFKLNGNLKYTIRPFADAWNHYLDTGFKFSS